MSNLSEILEIKNGKIATKGGSLYPIFGGNGIIGYSDSSNYENIIIIGRVGANCGSIHKYSDKCWVSDNALAGLPLNNCNDFNYYLLKSIDLNKAQIGSSQPLLTQSILYNIELNYPKDKIIQQKIASVLSSLDAKIELNNRINTELETMAKTLYDYWFVQFDFPDANGKPYKTSGGKMVWNEELKREIPEGWEVGTASDLFIFNPSLSLKKGAISSYIDMNALPLEGFMTKEVQTKEFNGGVKFQNGDVIIARITPCLENGKTGLITLLKEGEIGFGSTEFIVLRGKDRNLSCFAASLSRSELFRKYAIANMLGTSGRKRVEASKLGEFSMTIPPQDVLEKFERIVNSLFEKETLNTKETQHLASLRDWLLPMLMNGQVTVATSTCSAISEETKEEIIYNEKPVINLPEQHEQRFKLWLINQGVAARGDIDTKTLQAIFDAMDDEDK